MIFSTTFWMFLLLKIQRTRQQIYPLVELTIQSTRNLLMSSLHYRDALVVTIYRKSLNRSRALNTSRASNSRLGSDVIVLTESGGFYSRIYGIYEWLCRYFL